MVERPKTFKPVFRKIDQATGIHQTRNTNIVPRTRCESILNILLKGGKLKNLWIEPFPFSSSVKFLADEMLFNMQNHFTYVKTVIFW